MPNARVLLITALGAVLVWLLLAREVEPTLESLLQKTPSIEVTCASLLRDVQDASTTLRAKRTEPGIAAFVEVEGGLFRVLVGHDTEGEAWSAAVSGGE